MVWYYLYIATTICPLIILESIQPQKCNTYSLS